MNITILLADFAQSQNGEKLNAIGLGWTATRTPLPAHSVVLLLELETAEPALDWTLKVELVDSVDEPVVDHKGRPVQVEINLKAEAEKNEALVAGTTPIAFSVAQGLKVEPGVYKWRVTPLPDSGVTFSRSFEVRTVDQGKKSEN